MRQITFSHVFRVITDKQAGASGCPPQLLLGSSGPHRKHLVCIATQCQLAMLI